MNQVVIRLILPIAEWLHCGHVCIPYTAIFYTIACDSGASICLHTAISRSQAHVQSLVLNKTHAILHTISAQVYWIASVSISLFHDVSCVSCIIIPSVWYQPVSPALTEYTPPYHTGVYSYVHLRIRIDSTSRHVILPCCG